MSDWEIAGVEYDLYLDDGGTMSFDHFIDVFHPWLVRDGVQYYEDFEEDFYEEYDYDTGVVHPENEGWY